MCAIAYVGCAAQQRRIRVYERNYFSCRRLGDILVYRAGFAAEKKQYCVKNSDGVIKSYHLDRQEAINAAEEGECVEHERIVEPVENALHNVRSILERLTEGAYELYLSGSNNFRKELATLKTYKGNRARVGRPVHYDAIREYMVRKWDAIVVDGQEADDEIGIRATELTREGKSPIIVTIDKDLDMIPGTHYNWVKGEVNQIGKLEAWRCFYKQCLTGDRTDNIPGIDGIGDTRAGKLLADCEDQHAMNRVVIDAWLKAYPNGFTADDGRVVDTMKALEEVKQLLWIRRVRV